MKINYWGLPIAFLFLIHGGCGAKEFSSPSNTARGDTLEPSKKQVVKVDMEDSLHHLLAHYLQSKQVESLQLMDQIASKSDGYLTDEVQGTVQELFEKEAKNLILYLIQHKGTKLRTYLIYEWSADICVYKGEERKLKLATLKKEVVKVANSQRFSKEETIFLQKMLDEVDPSIYD